MSRPLRRRPLLPQTLLLALALLAGDAFAHDEGPPGFDCEEDGPFGLDVTGDPDEIGTWGPVLPWPVQATHATVMHNGNVLFWRIGDPAYEWDPVTESLTARDLETNAFCAGHGTLANGDVIEIGGSVFDDTFSLPEANVFDPDTGTWTALPDMADGRWYPTSTTLPDGRVLAFGGQITVTPLALNEIPEIYDPFTNTFTEIHSAAPRKGLYSYMFVIPDGNIFMAGPGGTTRILDMQKLTWSNTSPPNLINPNGSAAMYLPGKVVKTGGEEPAIDAVEVIDMNEPSPTWQEVGPMTFPRRRLDLVLLPDGTVLGVGGSVAGQNSPECAVHSATVWDPVTETWGDLAPMARPRIYHSTTVLLPDGRVLAAGGENSHTGGELSAEVYSPPYLHKGARPTIGSAPATITYDQAFAVESPEAGSIASIAFMRPGSITHNFDQNQRYVPLEFTVDGTTLDVTAPADANLAPPGYYMLFLVNGSGVPSVAAWVRMAQVCDDGADNDSDTLTDYGSDPGCSHPQDRSEGPDCSDGFDNDGDGLTDLADTGCDDANDLSERTPTYGCDDGVDNDGDGPMDYPGDVGCTSPTDADEDLASLPCDDGIDNDGDGDIDYPADRGCNNFDIDQTETSAQRICDDGIDNDGDGLIDYPDDPQCTSSADPTEAGDADGDGVEDEDDNCPNDPNPGQEDNDGDTSGDACDPDDDNDGLLDEYETNTGVYFSPQDTGTDPMDPDSDGDGLEDGNEVFLHATDPNNPDSDYDGYGDGAEVAAGTDPNDPDDFPAPLPALGPWGVGALVGGLLAAAGLRLRRRGERRAA